METLETLESFCDKKWNITYTKEQKKKFTNPANNFSLIGIDARHGFKGDSLKENKSPLMTLSKAEGLFTKCAKSYLEYKFNELKQNPSRQI